jgi:hypothetical protein
MLSHGSKKPRRDVKKSEFRDRVLFVLFFIVALSMYLWWSKSVPGTGHQSSPGRFCKLYHHVSTIYFLFLCMLAMEGVRQQTQQFIQQYKKQLSVDFDHVNPIPKDSDPNQIETPTLRMKPKERDKPSVLVAQDPNAVVHKDSGPLPLVRNFPHTLYTQQYMYISLKFYHHTNTSVQQYINTSFFCFIFCSCLYISYCFSDICHSAL